MKRIKTKVLEPKIAVISDLHGEKGACKRIIADVQEQNIDVVVLPGDIAGHNAGSLVWTLKQFLKLKIPVIIFGGSHENSKFYKQAMQKLRTEKNLIDAMKRSNAYISFGDYDLIMIPGCTVVGAGPRKNTGGNMWRIARGANKAQAKKKSTQRIRESGFSQEVNLVFMDDYVKILEANKTRPSKNKILFVHDPPLCKTKKGIDVAHFGQATKAFEISKKDLRKKIYPGKQERENFLKGSITILDAARKLKALGYPLVLKKKNVGDKELRTILNKYRITKLVCGHIHEAGPRAINKEEKKVRENTWNKEMYINSGEGQEGNYTILSLGKKGRIKYSFRKA